MPGDRGGAPGTRPRFKRCEATRGEPRRRLRSRRRSGSRRSVGAARRPRCASNSTRSCPRLTYANVRGLRSPRSTSGVKGAKSRSASRWRAARIDDLTQRCVDGRGGLSRAQHRRRRIDEIGVEVDVRALCRRPSHPDSIHPSKRRQDTSRAPGRRSAAVATRAEPHSRAPRHPPDRRSKRATQRMTCASRRLLRRSNCSRQVVAQLALGASQRSPHFESLFGRRSGKPVCRELCQRPSDPCPSSASAGRLSFHQLREISTARSPSRSRSMHTRTSRRSASVILTPASDCSRRRSARCCSPIVSNNPASRSSLSARARRSGADAVASTTRGGSATIAAIASLEASTRPATVDASGP